MPLQTLQFRPGIVKDVTSLSNSGGWYDADKIRFCMGFPETIGGWQKYSADTFLGSCRVLHQWASLAGTNYTALGTHLKLYVETGGAYYDITPIRRTVVLGANPFTTQSIANGKLTVTDAAHGAVLNDFVTFSGAAAFDNYTAVMLNAEFQIIEIINSSTYTVKVVGVTSAVAAVSGGGAAVTGAYQINTGPDTQVLGTGWGAGTYGRGTWGSASTSGVSTGQIRIWSLDNFGEDLVAAVRGGAIYTWVASTGTGVRAVNITSLTGANQAPTICTGIVVSEIDRHLIVFGTNKNGIATQDLMLVRWCSSEDLTEWESTPSTTAGSQRISAGSQIVGWVRARQEVLIWTDVALNSMAFTGPPYTFGFNLMAEGISIIGPNAMVQDRNTVFWMDRNSFRYYDGSLNTIACPVQEYVTNNLNADQRFKVACGSNPKFNEVWWFYPTASSSENDRYVIFNYVSNVWCIGTISRTAWVGLSVSGRPIAAAGGYMWEHEFGVNDGTSAMQPFIEGSDLQIGDGDSFSFISRVIPDITFTGTNATPLTTFKILKRDYPASTFAAGYTSTVASTTEQSFVRIRGRQFGLRVESNQTNQAWRLGTQRVELQPDGKKT